MTLETNSVPLALPVLGPRRQAAILHWQSQWHTEHLRTMTPFRGPPHTTGRASLFPAPVYLTVGVASGSAKSEIELVVVQPWNCWFDVLVDEPLR